MHLSAIGDNRAVADGATCSAQGIAEDSQEHDWCNDTLESEEVLHFGVWDAQEGQLEQEIEQETDHFVGLDAFVQWDVVGDLREAGPDGCEKDSHALSACGSLDTEKG